MDPKVDVNVDDDPPPAAVMATVLTWIGFDQVNTRNCIREDGFKTFEDFATMKEKDVRNLAESYGRCTIVDGRAILDFVESDVESV